MGTKSYTDAEKAETVAVFHAEGINAAMRHAACSKQSVYNWVRQSIDPEKTPEELAIDGLYQQSLRASAQRRFLEVIDDLLDRINQPHIDYRGKDVTRVEWPTATSSDVRNYAVAIGTFLDKYRLEMGEATSRTRIDAESVVDGELRRTMEEWQRQHIQTSPDSP